jgi:hypothetical protein
VGSIIGDPARPGRRAEPDQVARLDTVLDAGPDVLVLHEGPSGDQPDQRGSATIGARARVRPPALTVCGHIHWADPLARLGTGHVLNVDARVVVLVHVPS